MTGKDVLLECLVDILVIHNLCHGMCQGGCLPEVTTTWTFTPLAKYDRTSPKHNDIHKRTRLFVDRRTETCP